ncbi:MAG: hypothetical protein ABSB19_14100 [Methylomonas sp.]|jgi:hypothetical protein
MNKIYRRLSLLTALPLIWAPPASADVTYSTIAVSDTFLSSDPTYANRDMSAFGAMEISANLPDPLQGIDYPRTLDAVVAYDTSSIKAEFDAEFGAGDWHVTDVQVKWYSNFDILGIPTHNPQFNVPAAGAFNITLLADNSWFTEANAGADGLANPDFTWNSVFTAGGTYSNLLAGAQLLGTYDYLGGNFNGTNNCSNDVCDPRFWDLGQNATLYNTIASGGTVSLFGSAADDNVTYLINQLTKPGGQPQILVSAAAGAAPTPTPLPGPFWLFLSGCLSMLAIAKGRRKIN